MKDLTHTRPRDASNRRELTKSSPPPVDCGPATTYGSTMIIQCMPNLSATMPKRGEKKVFPV